MSWGVTDWQKGPDFTKPIPGITAPDDLTVVFQLVEPNAAFEATLLNFRNYILPSKQILAISPDIHTLDNKGIWALAVLAEPHRRRRPVPVGRRPRPASSCSSSRTRTRTGARARLRSARSSSSRSRTSRSPAAQVQSGRPRLCQTSTWVTYRRLSAAASRRRDGRRTLPDPRRLQPTPKASRFHDVKVRQAFMYGCDRQGFVDTFLQGKGLATDTYFFPDWVPKDGIKSYAFDIQKAQKSTS
jgi:hypothetical protein